MKNTSKFLRTFRLHTLITLVALVFEFILGMYTALFIEFPDTLVDGNGWGWAMKASPIIFAHVILGTLLILLAISTLAFGFASHSKNAIISSAAGLILMLVAYLSGSTFLANVAADNYSFAMALGFLGCMLAYGAAFYFTHPTEKI